MKPKKCYIKTRFGGSILKNANSDFFILQSFSKTGGSQLNELRVNPNQVRRRHRRLTDQLERFPTREELHSDLTSDDMGYSEEEANASIDAADFSESELSNGSETKASGKEDDNNPKEDAEHMNAKEKTALLFKGMKELAPTGAETVKVSELITFMEKYTDTATAQYIVTYNRGTGGRLDAPARGMVKLSKKGKKEMAEWESQLSPGSGGDDTDKQREADYVVSLFDEESESVEDGITHEDLVEYIEQRYEGEGENSLSYALELGTVVEVDGAVYRKGQEPPSPDEVDYSARAEQSIREAIQALRDDNDNIEARQQEAEEVKAEAERQIRELKEQRSNNDEKLVILTEIVPDDS